MARTPGVLQATRGTGPGRQRQDKRAQPGPLSHLASLVAPSPAKRILAISTDDASRFATLFGPDGVEEMPNIKFDRISTQDAAPTVQNPLAPLFPPDPDIIVLGSIRQEEEADIIKLICHLREQKQAEHHCRLPPTHAPPEKLGNAAGRATAARTNYDRAPPSPLVTAASSSGTPWARCSLPINLASAAFVGGSLAPAGWSEFPGAAQPVDSSR